ncbi:hypothetical protein VP96_02559 [Vibrio cholerae]|nr:hypothetical protein VIF_001373 [Vibrio cholerae TM 11079-80]KKP10683.1 hypothetical protein VP96_02559 [Vibrio cholerae]
MTPFGKEENSGNDESELLHPANNKRENPNNATFLITSP